MAFAFFLFFMQSKDVIVCCGDVQMDYNEKWYLYWVYISLLGNMPFDQQIETKIMCFEEFCKHDTNLKKVDDVFKMMYNLLYE